MDTHFAQSSEPSCASRVTALILAGGRSRRMGTDKALILWQGIPLLQRVFQVAQGCCNTVSVLTPWPEHYQGLLPNTVHWIVEPPIFAGPLAALCRGLETSQTPWVLLLACDLPQLNGAVLRQWIEGLDHTPGSFAVVPYHHNRWEPLCGFYRRECLPILKAFLAEQGDRASFQRWLEKMDGVPLGVDEAIAPMFHNCNTPHDLTVN